MQTIKKEAGITMLILVITIIILGIVGSILISYSVVGTKETKNKKYLTNLEIVQHAIYERYEQYKVTNDLTLLVGEPISGSNKPNVSLTWEDDNIYWNTSQADAKYHKLDKDDLKQLGIENVEDTEYIVNYKTQEVFDLTHVRISPTDLLYIK